MTWWVLHCRNDVPPQFPFFKGREAKKGKELYGDDYVAGTPVPLLADNFKWTAAMSFTFLVHGVALLSPLIKQKDEPMWVNFKLHQRFLLGLLQWSATIGQIRQLDLQIRQHAAGQRAIWQFQALVKFKNHAELHAADNFLRICPPRAGWCLKGNALLQCGRPLNCPYCVLPCRGNEVEGAEERCSTEQLHKPIAQHGGKHC